MLNGGQLATLRWGYLLPTSPQPQHQSFYDGRISMCVPARRHPCFRFGQGSTLPFAS